MAATIAVLILVIGFSLWMWYTAKDKAEDAVDAGAAKAEAKQAQEARAQLEAQRTRDNEAARQRDVREATEARASGRLGDWLRRSFEDDPSTN